MLKFFRTIRQRLLSESKFSKYLLYAIGEIVLVVIGILIALQINNWNESKKLDKKEIILLTQLRDDFKANLAQLENKIAFRNQIIKSSVYLLETVDNKLKRSKDSLIFHFQRTLYTPTFNSNTEDFYSSREVNLLKNDSLKVLLSKWPTRVNELNEEELVLLHHRDNRYIPYLSKYITIRDLYHMVELDLGVMDLIYPKNGKPLDVIIGMSKKSSGYDEILMADELEDYLSHIILFNNISQTQSVPLRELILQIIEQVDFSLEQLK